ncbi:MAG: D-alanine--D-alanine ligase family protein [Bacteroidales bacterium]|nr:D-alanine--D-alanine ligase family protein [Bacteroidales bacterium]
MKANIGVFFGGRSVEHEISIITAVQAIASFDKEKYNITPVYVTKKGKWYTGEALLELNNYKNIDSLLSKCTEVYMVPEYGNYGVYKTSAGIFDKKLITNLDVVFPAFHGTNGEDGVFQGVVESIGIPFVGCNTLASSNGMDKIFMKMILKDCEVPVIDCFWCTDFDLKNDLDNVIAKIEAKIPYPIIVKPANLGSSIGISKAADRDALIEALDLAAQFSSRIIAEKMVTNLKEINCSVLGDCDECEPSVCEEPVKTEDILSYKDKYLGGSKTSKGMQSTQRRLPADLPDDVTAEIRSLAVKTFKSLSCNGVSRIDFIIDTDTNEIFVNEINTIPGSLSFYLWEATGVSFKDLIDRLINLAYKRKRKTDNKVASYDQNIFNFQKDFSGGKLGVK